MSKIEEIFEHDNMDLIKDKLDERQESVLDTAMIADETVEDTEEINAELMKILGNVDGPLEKYSTSLAENVIKEAILIKETIDKDRLKVGGVETEDEKMGDRGNADARPCDSYLLEKLLHSVPDQTESVEYAGFDGKEEHFTHESDTDPDIPADDNAENVEALLSRKDQPFNKHAFNGHTASLDNFGDSGLQVIHEDSELKIETFSDMRNAIPEPTEHVTAQTNGDDGRQKVPENVPREDDEVKPSQPAGDQQADQQPEEEEEESSDEELLSGLDTEEELDCCEMTTKEKTRVVRAVRKGKINKLELLLEKRNADMDMTWFGENLLMIAIKEGRQKMAEFLIDNDINWNFGATLVDRNGDGRLEMFTITARQLAYERNMLDIVELIDQKNSNMFRFIKPRERQIRLRRPKPPTPTPPPPEESEENFGENEEGTCQRPNSGAKNDNSIGIKNDNSILDEESGLHSFRSTSKVTDKLTVSSRPTTEKHKRIEETANEHRSTADHGTASNNSSKDSCRSESSHSSDDSNAELSRVFGNDDGYETMSPISPYAYHIVPKLEHSVVGTKEHVNVRGTKASHTFRAHTAAARAARSPAVREHSMHHLGTIGSYGFESKQWQRTRSAPLPVNYSVESIPDMCVRTGAPFVHNKRKQMSLSADTKQLTEQRNISSRPTTSFSNVTRALSPQKRPQTYGNTSFPSINSNKGLKQGPLGTHVNYIYANRSINSPKTATMTTSKHKQSTDLFYQRRIIF